LQLATLRIGMRITLLAPLVAAATLVLARRGDMIMGPIASVFVAFAVSAAMATLLPYDRFFRIGWGLAGLYVWSAVNLVMIAVGVWATGGPDSPLVFLYALTTLFFAVAFSTRVQVVFFVMMLATHATIVGPPGWDPLHIGVLTLLAFLANLLVGQLKRQMTAHRAARLESERRWALLAVVSSAGRKMSAVEPLAVLGAIVDSVVALGFPVTRIYVQEEGGFRVILPPETTRDFPGGIEAFPAEAVDRVLREARTVVIGDDLDGTGDEHLAAIRLRSAVIVPITTGERADALLVVGKEKGPAPAGQDLEVFQMLAQQGAVALENARRFEQQRRAMERLAELDRMKSDFLSSVSHELRTPLTVIAGMGRTLEAGWEHIGDEDRHDLLARLNANAASLDTLIGELLDFGRLDSGQLEIEPVTFDLRALAAGVVDRLSSLFRRHIVQIDVEEGISAFADPMLIERVIENLLTNAAKYTPPGSRVVMAAEVAGREVIVSVTDDGPGIPTDELAHIGQRFFRGGDPNTRSTRGSGLGLALASQVLDLHGTFLEVTSEVGRGSRFAFRLPLGNIEAVANESPAAPAARSLIVTDGGLPGERFETVMAAARSGLEWAVAILYREFHPRVLRYLCAQMPEQAEQLARVTWNDIASGLPSFDGDEASFRRWLFAVARGHLIDASRPSNRVLPRAEPARVGHITTRPVRPVDEALVRIGSLKPEQADVLLLRTVGGLDVVQVAEITGETADVVRLAEEEGLQQLRRWSDEGRVDRVGTRAER
jgi:signal transduction histidine kinase/DNA-directed RNA polymerase specialized sigma24 family protein